MNSQEKKPVLAAEPEKGMATEKSGQKEDDLIVMDLETEVREVQSQRVGAVSAAESEVEVAKEEDTG